MKVGGVEKRLLYILKKLKESGRYDPCVICIHSKGPLAPFFERAGIPVYLVKFNSRFDPRAIFEMVKLFKKLGVDVVHTHMYRPGISGAIAAKIYGAKLVGNVHNLEHWDNKRQIFMDRIFNPLRDLVICVSRAVLKDYCQKTLLTPDRAKVVYNGIDVSEFKCAPKEKEKFVCLCVSRLVPQKRVDRVLEFFSFIRNKIMNIVLFIIGKGPLFDQLKKAYQDVEDVFFLGEKFNINEYYSKAHFLFLLSEKEGFANVILEAMASCVVPVVTNVGGNNEVVEHGKCGFWGENEGFPLIIFDIKKLKKIQRNAYLKVYRNYTLHHMYDITDTIYSFYLIT